MQLDRIAIVLRQRSGWEAIDLGFRMAVRWARPLWRVWFALFLPLAATLILALREQPFLAALALWWIKPALDRFLLHVLARATFGEVPGLAGTLGAWRTLLGARLWPELLLRPLAFRRSFLAPVAQLEGQRGAAARRRAAVLGRRLSGHVLALAFICVCFEWVVLIGAEMAIELLRPGGWLGEAEPEPDGPFWQPEWWSLGTTLAYALAISVIEPFFVAAGFSLYLNRRVMLEGWDIELALRRLQAAAGALLVLPLLAVALATASPAALAQADTSGPVRTIEAEAPGEQDVSGRVLDSAPDKTAPGLDLEAPIEAEAGGCDVPDEASQASAYRPLDSEARRQIETVLAHPDFGSTRQVERWRPRQREATERDMPALGWLADIAGFIASGLRALAWIALAALLIAAVWLVARRWQLREPGAARAAPPAVLFGLAIAPESLPDDIAAAALAAIAEGRLREALSLLYRGALSQLVHARGLRVGSGATEGDVLNLARRALAPGEAGFFERLLPVWIDLAYAHREPDAAPLRALCADYARHFQRATPEAAA